MSLRAWRDIVHETGDSPHVLQVYDDERSMEGAVAAWILPPLLADGGAVLVCTPAHATGILARVSAAGVDVAAARASGRLKHVVADVFMSRFMVNGMPDGNIFKNAVRDVLRGLRMSCSGEIRAWGEMVDLLAKRNNLPAAVRLEALWNEVIDQHRIRLLCSYEADRLSPEAQTLLQGACGTHSHFLATPDQSAFDLAVGRALQEVLGGEGVAELERSLSRSRPGVIRGPASEARLMALHADRPDTVRRVLRATRVHLDAIRGSKAVSVP